MLDASQIEQVLRAATTAPLPGRVADFARLLAEVIHGRLSIPEAQKRFASIPQGAELLRALAGRKLELPTGAITEAAGLGVNALAVQAGGDSYIDQSCKVIDFGSDNRMGNIAIRDVAGRDLFNISLSIHLAPHRPAPRPQFQEAPYLSEELIPRSEVTRPLKDGLLAIAGPATSARVMTVRGLGGVGKTTLVGALVRDPGVQGAFPGGIYWVTLGPRPDVAGGLAKLYAALTGERPAFQDVEDASHQVSAALEDRRSLIVLDDAWDDDHVAPFLSPREHSSCTWVITTRRPEVTRNARGFEVDMMSPEESVTLLLARSGLTAVDQEALHALAGRLGRWPILLDLTGSTLRKRVRLGDTPKDALDFVNRSLDRKGGESFDQTMVSSDRSQSLARTIEVSLDFLSPDQSQHYKELVVFPEEAIPLKQAATLWGIELLDAEDLAMELHDLALLKSRSGVKDPPPPRDLPRLPLAPSR